MRKIMFFAFSFLMTTGASISAQEVVKVAKDSTITTIKTTTIVEPFKSEMKIPADSTKTTVITTKTTEPVKTEIKSSELPQPVKDLGASFKSQGWDTAEKAYVVKGVTGDVVFYVVTFKNPTSGESKSINIDANGNIVKE
jgi:hypothetical protein